MNRKKITLNIAKAAVFLAVFLLLFSGVNYVLRLKANATYVYPFYEEPQGSIDVVFAGSSHMLNAVLPLQLWEEQGITSFNIAQHAQSLPITYYAVADAIDRQRPKLVVVDMFHIIMEEKYNPDSLRLIHETFDNMPPSKHKLTGIYNVIARENQEEFYLPIELFHNRWKDLGRIDFTAVADWTKGAQLNNGIMKFSTFPVLDAEQTMEIPQVHLDYLERLIALCKRENTPLLLINLPFYATGQNEYTQRLANMVGKVADREGVPYLNFFHRLDEVAFDFATDLKDAGHMNPAGAAKLTGYLGSYLGDNYELADHRDDPAYADWHSDYDEYIYVRDANLLRQETDLSIYLDKLTGKDYVVALTLKGATGDYMTPELMVQLRKLGLKTDLTNQHITGYIALLDHGELVAEKSTKDSTRELTTKKVVDGVQFRLTSSLQNAQIYVAGNARGRNGKSLNIVVWDKLRDQVVDSVRFNIDDPAYFCARK